MADKGTRATDREFSSLKRSVKRVYQQAYHEVAQKAADFAKAHEERAAKYQQMVKDGKMTQADYDAWLRGQVFQGEKWKARVEQMAQSLYHADQTAMAMQNKARMNVFAQNANAITREISDDIHSQVNFTAYDANAVQRLVQQRPDVLPPRKVGRDKAYRWYKHRMNDVLQQGIVQGESIQDIALRIGKECSESCLTSMLRNARTGFTGAQNAGRLEGLKQAKEMGINVKKQWLATPDARTRDTHAELDGEIVDVDEPFITSAGNEIMYPGDPMAAPEEVWNCRCTLVYVYPDYDELEKPEDEETAETAESTGIESLRAIAEASQDKFDFWTSLDEDQQMVFMASGLSLDDAYEMLGGGSGATEWVEPRPGGAEDFAITSTTLVDSVTFRPERARSDGWMAEAGTPGVIRVRDDGLGDEWKFIMAHEAGHQLSTLTPELERIITVNPGGVLGRYNQKRGYFDGACGEYNPEEAWASSVAAFILSPEWLQEKYPEAHDAVSAFFEATPSARRFIEGVLADYEREYR